MNASRYRRYAHAAGLLLLLSIVGLWSWNTLAELFNLPDAQYKHALAASGLLVVAKWALSPHRRRSHSSIG